MFTNARILTLSMCIAAGAAHAQVAQTGVVGTTDDPVYTTLVQGADGNLYECLPEIENRDGQKVRRCRPQGVVAANSSDPFAGITGTGGGVGVGVVGLILAALAVGASSSSTN
ncbi:hypothetical protein [Pseudaestuariivita atlantica]|uniref:Uncharacterized protein n=1 Tax=Pseudaestuariivita atlantica TaxID=1317121 RepID=A0A0L1JUA4_9RHOB|nr:hypothetical protein [Pseudaestuariivita atlantica]KNG95277.1 hypothetical protein ATO11_01175 [Pseudaestuariivita atlantica]